MPPEEKLPPKQDLDRFFYHLYTFGFYQFVMTGEYPKRLHINPVVLRDLSNVPGFFQREELRTEVTTHSPVISRIRLPWGVVTIREDYEEPFMHLE